MIAMSRKKSIVLQWLLVQISHIKRELLIKVGNRIMHQIHTLQAAQHHWDTEVPWKKIVRKACNYILCRNAQANVLLVFPASGGFDLVAFGFGCGCVGGRWIARVYVGPACNTPTVRKRCSELCVTMSWAHNWNII